MSQDVILSIGEKLINPIIEYITKRFRQAQEITVHYGDRIALKACNGLYVQVDGNNALGNLIARGDRVEGWENFEIVNCEDPLSYVKGVPVHYGEQIALKALYFNQFIGVNYNDGQKYLTYCMPDVELWETFTLCAPPKNKAKRNGETLYYGNRIALKANRGEYVMSHQMKDGILTASGSEIGKWEKFFLINPKEPK